MKGLRLFFLLIIAGIALAQVKIDENIMKNLGFGGNNCYNLRNEPNTCLKDYERKLMSYSGR